MIVIAIVGILAAVSMPAYRDYLKTSNMARVNAQFESAIRVSRSTFVKGNTQIALGLSSTVPTSSEGWITLFNPQSALAPGGGTAYQTSPDNTSGVIGVSGNAASISIVRPSYLDYSTNVTATVVAADEA